MKQLIYPIVLLLALTACREEQGPNKAQEHMHSSTFDELVNRFEDSTRAEWQKRETVIEYMNLDSNDVVADIGAGTGYFTFPMAKKCGKVIAIDIDNNFINYLVGQKAIQGADNVEVRQSEPDNPKLAELECDKVIIVNTVHHFDKVAKYLNKVRKSLHFGGSLYIVDFKEGDLPVGPPNNIKISLSDMKRELGLAGFNKLEVDTETLPYQYIIKAN